MNSSEIEKVGKNLQNRFLLFGHFIRMAAVKKLVSDLSPESIPHLVIAMTLLDPKVAHAALQSLGNIKNQPSIDEFCRIWFEGRDKAIENIIISSKYVASEPLEIRVATALKTGKTELCDKVPLVEFLVKFLADKDATISTNAQIALRLLKDQDAIDAFCQTWYSKRDSHLEKIELSSKYVASKPLEIRIATALKTGKTGLCDNISSFEFLLKFQNDKDFQMSKNSKIALRSFKNQETIEFFCDNIIDGKLDVAKSIAVEMNYLPAQVSRRCLFLVITGQIEKYFDLDHEFQYLRAEYQAAPEELQQRIRSVIQQSGDHRLIGLFGEVRKKFVAKDLTEHEADLMLEVYARNKQTEEIFALLFFAPLTVVVKAIDVLMSSRWQPLDEDRRELWKNLIHARQSMGYKPQLPPEPEVALGSVFKKWFETGRKDYTSKPEIELREYVKTGTPLEAVAALVALSAKNLIKPNDHEKLKNHPHWLVRMAYLASGYLIPEDIFSNKTVSCEGGEYWIEKMVPSFMATAFLQLKPVNITPDRLQQLASFIANAGKNTNDMIQWATLLTLLAGYTLRNLISIGKYEKQIEDTAITL